MKYNKDLLIKQLKDNLTLLEFNISREKNKNKAELLRKERLMILEDLELLTYNI